MESKLTELSERLIDWFDHQARDLPWRRERTPYRAWVAEVMLQQTRVESAVPYYERFLARFPTLEALAAAPLEDVLRLWEGLGYYTRARNLHTAARRVVDEYRGHLPTTYEELRTLPGVGPYIAGALASIVFDRPVVAVDGNARRVLTRLFAVPGDPRRSPVRQQIEELARTLLPAERPGALNEALIELGATICRPRRPQCPRCPLDGLCQARLAGREADFPQLPPRATVPHYDVCAAVLLREDGQVLVARRNLDDFLGGLWEFPGGKQEQGESLPECTIREMAEELDVTVTVGDKLMTIEHGYTHFRITLHVFLCRLQAGEPHCLDCADVRWVQPAELDALPMSVTDRQIARAVQSSHWKAILHP